MVVDIREMTDPPTFRLTYGTTNVPKGQQRLDAGSEDVVEVVNRILGYDAAEQTILAEGYHVMATDAADWADVAFIAQAEVLPEE